MIWVKGKTLQNFFPSLKGLPKGTPNLLYLEKDDFCKMQKSS
jgi:hypothetical protein